MKNLKNYVFDKNLKSLDSYFDEDCTTPASTLGMGNPAMPVGDQYGSGDMFIPKYSKYMKKKQKHNLNRKKQKQYNME